MFTLVKKLTGVGRHLVVAFMAAMWASNGRAEFNRFSVVRGACVASSMHFGTLIVPNGREEKSKHPRVQKIGPVVRVVEMIAIKNQETACKSCQQGICASVFAI